MILVDKTRRYEWMQTLKPEIKFFPIEYTRKDFFRGKMLFFQSIHEMLLLITAKSLEGLVHLLLILVFD